MKRLRELFDLKKLLFSRIGIKLPIIFLLVGIVAPTIGIAYYYSISTTLLTEPSLEGELRSTLQGVAIIIILLIAFNTGLLGFFISRSFTKPIKELNKATKELEKGNFSVQTHIKTKDELAQLSIAFNKTALALSKMEEERLQLDKAKTEFLSITSHELRTPITPLKAQLQMLQQGYFGTLTEKQKESLDIVLRNAERLNKIIEDFLEISRIEAARLKFFFRKTNLQDMMRDTVGLLEGFAKEKNITLLVTSDQLPIIDADPDRLSQVLRNITHNAIKFSPNDSCIQVHAELKNNYVLFSVKDQGVGMNAEDQIRVFEPFYQIEATLNRMHGGTGLGLTICRGIIEAQKGKIWVESTLGKGSTFYFTVPLVPVYDIEPIKVLFSPKTDIERKVKEEFTAILGPMGIVEFDELKNRHALGKQDLFTYISQLEEQRILRPTHAEEFRKNIGKIFGEEYIKEKPVTLNETGSGHGAMMS